MPTTVTFSPGTITCGVTAPGATTTASAQCGDLSAPANVTASISADTSGGALKVQSVTSMIMKQETETVDPGETLGGKPVKPIIINVPEQVAQSNGVTPLAVATGQYVVVNVQFSPTASTPDACTATLNITGDTWNPVSIPVTASVGAISVKVPSISVVQGKSTTIDVTLTLTAGAPTTADIILDADGSAEAPTVGITPKTASLSLTKGTAVPLKLTVTADVSLAPGSYGWSLAVWSYDKTTSFSVPVNVTVGVPWFAIKSKLGNVIDIVGASTAAGAGLDAYTQKTSGNDNQLWNFVADSSGYFYIVSKLNGNVIDIKGDSTTSGALLDSYPKKSGADNQLWCFVQDPAGSGACFIVSKLNGNVIDVQDGSTASGALLDAYPVKLTNYQNQLWTVVGGSFPNVLPTAQASTLSLGGGFHNYFLDSGGDALTGVSVTVTITDDFVSTANGYSFQLNCNSTEGPTVTTVWQQFLIYANPGSNQLVASLQTWSGSAITDVLNNIHVPLATLPSTTLPKGYKFNIVLNYYSAYPVDGYSDPSALVSGAVFTVTDNTGKSLGSTTITIIGTDLISTGAPATVANLAPVAALQLDIGGYENATRATLTGGTGKISYVATEGLSPSWTAPSYTTGEGTAESGNIVFGPLPWPFSASMESLEPGTEIEQIFEAVSGLAVLAPLDALKTTRRVLPPPKMTATAKS